MSEEPLSNLTLQDLINMVAYQEHVEAIKKKEEENTDDE